MTDKCYKLVNANGQFYLSKEKGTLGGNKKLKIYGRLDCKSALRYIEKGFYVKNRVFFTDEQTAISAGYRPCAICMPLEYAEWKNSYQKIYH
jgi:methylphosphotriester-DNA--protein-cysteine methyltransferase